MKKSLIALSVIAGMVGVAQAAENTTTLYGSIGYSVGFDGQNKVDDDGYIVHKVGDGIKDFGKSIKNNVWDLKRTTANFGIKGTEAISNDLEAFYDFKFGISDKGVDDTQYANLGLRGSFGTITLGKQDTVYKQAVTYNDNFNGDGIFLSKRYSDADTLGKVVSYVTPDMAGFKLAGAAQIDGKNPNEKGVDLWEVGAFYDANGIFAGVAYDRVSTNAIKKDSVFERMGASAGYKNDMFKAGVGYEHNAGTMFSNYFHNYYNVAGEYYLGQNTFRAGVAYSDSKDSKMNVLESALGYQYNLSDRTYTWLEGQYKKYKDKSVDDGYQVVVGVRHDF